VELGMNKKDLLKLINKSYRFDKSSNSYILDDYSQLPSIIRILTTTLGGLNAVPITSIEDITSDFNREVKLLFQKFAPNIKYTNAIANQSASVGLCLLSLMQGMTFALFDGTVGTLSLHDFEFISPHSSKMVVENSVIAIFGTIINVGVKKMKIASPIISSNLLWSSHINTGSFEQARLMRSTAVRDGNGNEPLVWVVKQDETGVHKLYPAHK
jgi:hypothetical protein